MALYVVSDFGAVSLLRTDTLTRAIFIQYQTSFDRAAAAVLGLELVGLVALILVLEWLYRRRGRFHGSGPGTPGPPRLLRLGRWRWPALAFLAAIVLVALGVPAGVLLHWLVRGLQAGEPFAGAWGAALNSAWVSAVAGLVAVVVAIPVAIVAVRKPSPLAALVERVGYTGFALPGIVVALSLVFFGLRVVPAVYQSWVLLGFRLSRALFPAGAGRHPDFAGPDPSRDRRGRPQLGRIAGARAGHDHDSPARPWTRERLCAGFPHRYERIARDAPSRTDRI